MCMCYFTCRCIAAGLIPFQGNSVASETLWGTLCVISLEARVKSIQGVIGTSERVTALPFLCLHLTDSEPRLRVGKHAL